MNNEYIIKVFNFEDHNKIVDFVFNNNISKYSKEYNSFIDFLKKIKNFIQNSPTGHTVIRNFSSYDSSFLKICCNDPNPTLEIVASIDFDNILFVAKKNNIQIERFNPDDTGLDINIGSYDLCSKNILSYFNVYNYLPTDIKNIFSIENSSDIVAGKNIAIIEKIFKNYSLLSFPTDKYNTQESIKTAFVTPLGIVEQYLNVIQNPFKNKNLEDILDMCSVNVLNGAGDFNNINNSLAERILRDF